CLQVALLPEIIVIALADRDDTGGGSGAFGHGTSSFALACILEERIPGTASFTGSSHSPSPPSGRVEQDSGRIGSRQPDAKNAPARGRSNECRCCVWPWSGLGSGWLCQAAAPRMSPFRSQTAKVAAKVSVSSSPVLHQRKEGRH